MSDDKKTMRASDFKAQCLKVMDRVYQKHIDITITKRGKPVAKMVPVEKAITPDIFGCMAGTVTIHGDIISPLEDEWEANE